MAVFFGRRGPGGGGDGHGQSRGKGDSADACPSRRIDILTSVSCQKGRQGFTNRNAMAVAKPRLAGDSACFKNEGRGQSVRVEHLQVLLERQTISSRGKHFGRQGAIKQKAQGRKVHLISLLVWKGVTGLDVERCKFVPGGGGKKGGFGSSPLQFRGRTRGRQLLRRL